MGRRSGQRIVAAKAFIEHKLRSVENITVATVMKEFPDVATCRSIYRWIAHAKTAVENPGQINKRSSARQFIHENVHRGARVRDVLLRFPGVASTTTVYRWLHEAKQPLREAHADSQSFVWHVLDNDPAAVPTYSNTSSNVPHCIGPASWQRIRERHSQLVQSVAKSVVPGQTLDAMTAQRLEMHLQAIFPDAPVDIVKRLVDKRAKRHDAVIQLPSSNSTITTLKYTDIPFPVAMKTLAPGQMLAPKPRRLQPNSAKEGCKIREGFHRSESFMHLCCDCRKWLHSNETAWVPTELKKNSLSVTKIFPVSDQFVHTRIDEHGQTLVSSCVECSHKKHGAGASLSNLNTEIIHDNSVDDTTVKGFRVLNNTYSSTMEGDKHEQRDEGAATKTTQQARRKKYDDKANADADDMMMGEADTTTERMAMALIDLYTTTCRETDYPLGHQNV